MQPLRILKSVEIQDVSRQQTLLILPADFIKRFSEDHSVTFAELNLHTLLLKVIAPNARSLGKTYKTVRHQGSTQVSVPRWWLRNIGARHGDRIDLYSTIDPDVLLLKFRRGGTLP